MYYSGAVLLCVLLCALLGCSTTLCITQVHHSGVPLRCTTLAPSVAETDLYELSETIFLTTSGKLAANGVYNHVDSIFANLDPIGLSILTLTPLGLGQ